jgi:flagellar motor switch protein FliM
MKDLLSQAEIDALLANVQAQDLAVKKSHRSAQSFDLASRRRLKKRPLPGLEHINRRFAERFRQTISDVLGQRVDVTPIDLQFQPYGEYLHSLYVPTSINIMRLNPLQGAAMIVFDARLVFRLVDIFFGGSGGHGNVDGRDFSAVERRVVSRIIAKAHCDYESAWQMTQEVQCESVAMEVNPAMAAIVGQAEIVVVCRFQLEFEGGGGGEFHITLPQTLLDPVRDLLSKSEYSQPSAEDPRWRAMLSQALLDTRVSTRCTLAEPLMSLREISHLKVGDLIALDSVECSVLKVAGVSFAKAKLRIDNARLSLSIVD